MRKNKKIESLRNYLQKRDDVLIAFLFGSYAEGFIKRESDFDLAVYLKDKKERKNIYLDAVKVTKREINLICLDEAVASLVSNIFKTAIPLTIKSERLYWDLYLKKSLEAEDFLDLQRITEGFINSQDP